MHHIHDIETMREHRQVLIAEAENARLARQLKQVRRNSGKAHSGRMQLRAVLLLFTIGLALLFAVSAAKPVPADTTFTVTSTSDSSNGACDAVCTLREAITAANNTPGRDTINFRLSNTGEARTILPTSPLPEITETVTIDGYSQLGSSVNTLDKGTNAVLRVELDGSLAGADASGLNVGEAASNVVVRGLVINRFDFAGVEIRGSGTKVEGNFIGTDPSGTLDRGIGDFGGVLVKSNSNTIGGASHGRRNLISGNGDGVNLNPGAEGNKVQGNLIGTQKDGTSPLGNDFSGVVVIGGERNLIGGTRPGEANTIAFNSGNGVEVSFDVTGNRVSANSIFSNDGLGIDLEGGTENAQGATRNDPGDTDTGPNNLQNKPVLTSAVTSGGTTISGRLDSTATDPFVVEFYSNPSGGNEGKKIIGTRAVSTNASGSVTFTFTPSQAVPTGQTVTATATNSVSGDTSEFSAPRKVVAQ